MATKQLFCTTCDELRNTKERLTTIKHNIRDEEIRVNVMIPYCSECNSQLSELDSEENHFNLALKEYRKIKKLLMPEEIKAIRESYGLSQRAFARALGFAEPTINRYELGAIQDMPHNNLILLAKDPKNMLILASQNKNNLTEKEFNLISQKVVKEEVKIPSDLMASLIKKVNKMDEKLDFLIQNNKRQSDRWDSSLFGEGLSYKRKSVASFLGIAN